MFDDFVEMWSAKERGRDGLVPASFDEGANRRLLRQASVARALCIAAVVELTAVLFVANWFPAAVTNALWAVFAVTVVAAVVLGARSLSALSRAEREGTATEARRPRPPTES